MALWRSAGVNKRSSQPNIDPHRTASIDCKPAAGCDRFFDEPYRRSRFYLRHRGLHESNQLDTDNHADEFQAYDCVDGCRRDQLLSTVLSSSPARQLITEPVEIREAIREGRPNGFIQGIISRI